MKQWLLIGALAFMVGLPAAWANVYNFNYTGTGVTASGSLDVTSQGVNTWLITGISGKRNDVAITGLLPVGALLDGGAVDNLIYFVAPPPTSIGTFTLAPPSKAGGFAYTVFGVTDAYDPYTAGENAVFSGGVAVPAGQYEYQVNHWPGSNQAITFTLAATPEPGFYGVLALGLGGLFVGVRRRRRA